MASLDLKVIARQADEECKDTAGCLLLGLAFQDSEWRTTFAIKMKMPIASWKRRGVSELQILDALPL